MPPHRLTSDVVSELRAIIGEPTELVCSKIADRLNELTRQFVERANFVLVATCDEGGACDVSFVERSALPSSGEIFRMRKGGDFDAKQYDDERAARHARREGFY